MLKYVKGFNFYEWLVIGAAALVIYFVFRLVVKLLRGPKRVEEDRQPAKVKEWRYSQRINNFLQLCRRGTDSAAVCVQQRIPYLVLTSADYLTESDIPSDKRELLLGAHVVREFDPRDRTSQYAIGAYVAVLDHRLRHGISEELRQKSAAEIRAVILFAMQMLPLELARSIVIEGLPSDRREMANAIFDAPAILRSQANKKATTSPTGAPSLEVNFGHDG